ncbi:MAG: FtsX-like permease family protein [Acidimicrobiia bacterium]
MRAASARRAVLRWAWRLFRREWRQQILVVTLLAVAVTAATFGAAFTYNMSSDGEGQFGSADQLISFDGSDPEATATDIAAARRFFGTIDVITNRPFRVPGLGKPFPLRAQDPDGPFTGAMLALRSGRYPTGAGDVALTEDLVHLFDVTVGGTVEIDGRSLTMVGVVENQGDLSENFALVTPAEAPGGRAGGPESVTILVAGSRDGVEAFRNTMTVAGNVMRDSRRNDKAAAALATFSMAAVAMLLVALIAAAGFLVIAQRRLRSLGMMSALGATERHVRLVTLLNGTLVGVAAAAIGTLTGLLVWAAATSRVEEAAGHRIDGLSVPWWLVATGVGLAVVTATGAAWWPARAMARIPTVAALSMRPPRPKPAHRSAVVAVLLVLAGVGCFALARGMDPSHRGASAAYPWLIIAGTLAIPIGVLMISPLAVRAAARWTGRLPVAGRLALRDLGRYQARAGAALAAISLALGVPVAVVIAASAGERGAAEGNLSDRQLMIRFDSPFLDTERTAAEVQTLDARIDEFAATLGDGGAGVTPLDVPVNPDVPTDVGPRGPVRPPVALYRHSAGAEHAEGVPLYVATPELLAAVGADPGAVDAHELFTTNIDAELQLYSTKMDHTPVTDAVAIEAPAYYSLPESFLSPSAVRAHGWERSRTGWLVESGQALTGPERDAARDLALEAGLNIETRQDQSSLQTLRTGATAAGMLMALGVLAMTVGLIRTEGAGDLRTLTATGATGTVRRNLTAATAGALALLGVVLGTAGAYLVMIGAYLGRLDELTNIPVAHLGAISLGVPVVAVVSGWLLSGRQPSVIARAAFE